MPSENEKKSLDTVPRGEPERSLRLSITEGLFASVHSAVTGGSLVTAFALLLGANDFHLGTLSAIGAFTTLGCLLSAYWVGCLGRRKGIVLWSITLNRILWGLVGLIPFLFGKSETSIAVMLLLTLVLGLLMQISNNAWTAWMTDLVPLERRGRYFGVRNTLLGLVSQAAALGSAKAIDHFKACGQEEIGFLSVFAGSSLLALFSSILLARQWEPPSHGEKPVAVMRMLRLPFADLNFRRFMWFILFWSVAIGIAGPFWVAHMLKNLHMTYADIALYGLISMLSAMFSQLWWGRMIDRAGSHAVLMANLICVSLLPLIWLFARPGFLLPIWIDAFLTGIFWPGFNLAQFNMTLLVAPSENRSAYLAMQSAVGGISGFLISILAGILAYSLSGASWKFQGYAFCNYHLMFVLSSALRLCMIPLVRSLRFAPAADKIHPPEQPAVVS